jgi:hypothetical protein
VTVHRRPRLHAAALAAAVCFAALAGVAGCATRAVNVAPLPTNPAEFIAWDCTRIDDERDAVQQRAADVAYAVDERVGNNILALGVGVTVFWPALFAMRPDGLEAADLARLKGRFEALTVASANKGCPPPGETVSAARAAALPLTVGERLVYDERGSSRGPSAEWGLRLTALRRGELEYRVEPPRGAGAAGTVWRQDRAGNVTAAPPGSLLWPQLLRGELVLGAVTAGDIVVVGDPLARARMRGQVVAVGPQTIAGRRFDAVVVELFGDATRGEDSTRVDGAIVVDRASGVLLRLDLRSAHHSFSLQRRLVRVEPAT